VRDLDFLRQRGTASSAAAMSAAAPCRMRLFMGLSSVLIGIDAV